MLGHNHAKRHMSVCKSLYVAGCFLAAATLGASTGHAQNAEAAKATSQPLLETSTHRDGVPITYPTGSPLITARTTTIPPGVKLARHRHEVPLFTYILDGELTLHDDDGSSHRFSQGQAFMEADGWHYATNDADVPVRLLAVYVGQVGVPLSVSPPK